MLVKHLYPQTDCRDADGRRQWERYSKQIVAISLQWPHAFAPEIAKKAIPADAYHHHCYLALDDEDNVQAYCVVVLTHRSAELLWGATDRGLTNRRKYLGHLFTKIEKELFASTSDVDMIIGKVAIPASKYKDTEVGGEEWNNTNRFHRSMGYRFLYALEHYWHTGDHALLMVKRRKKGLYGYDEYKLSTPPVTQSVSSSDENPDENLIIYDDIRSYLAEYEQEARNIEASLKGAPDKDILFAGFVGMAFVPANSEFITMFASKTVQPEKENGFKFKFEYEKDRSSITRLLTDESLPQTAVIEYPLSYDRGSEIAIHDYFKTFFPKFASAYGYTVFLHRFHKSEDGSFAAIYTVFPMIQNVVRERRNWKNLANFSYSMIWGIYHVLSELCRTRYQDNAYINSLKNCLSIPHSLRDLFDKYDEYIVEDAHEMIDVSMAHDLRCSLRNAVIDPLTRSKADDDELNSVIDRCTSTVEQYCDKLSMLIDGFKNARDSAPKRTTLTASLVKEWLSNSDNLPGDSGICSKDDSIAVSFNPDEPFTLNISEKTLKTLFHIIINNALDAFIGTSGKSRQELKIRIEVDAVEVKKRPYLGISFWNSDTRYPLSVIDIAGNRPYTRRLAQGHSGLGLYILEFLLKLSGAIKSDKHKRHFELFNTDQPKGAKIHFLLPLAKE